MHWQRPTEGKQCFEGSLRRRASFRSAGRWQVTIDGNDTSGWLWLLTCFVHLNIHLLTMFQAILLLCRHTCRNLNFKLHMHTRPSLAFSMMQCPLVPAAKRNSRHAAIGALV